MHVGRTVFSQLMDLFPVVEFRRCVERQTIRRGLLKIGAQVKVSVRRVYLLLAGGYPYEESFAALYRALRPPGLATV